ncbi:MAG: ABC transporter permease [Clostridiaceae bacterium]|nr:ABC transporter permease [Clostridiaceae bacterium]
MKISKENFRINPVLLKELKVKMRGWRAVFLIGIYNLVLGLITIFMMKISMAGSMGRIESRSIFSTYIFMVIVQYCLIGLIAPALTAGSISGEREKQTLDILMSTTLRQGSIIAGKLFASLSHIILLVISSIPIFSIIFLYGIIGVKELAQVFLYYIISAITLGSIGLFFSTYIKKSTAANVLSYAVVMFLVFGTLLITLFYVQLVVVPKLNISHTPYNETFWLMYLNPISGLASLLSTQLGQGMGSFLPGLYISGKQSGLLVWHINSMINIAISAILLWLSALKLNPARRKLFKRK